MPGPRQRSYNRSRNGNGNGNAPAYAYTSASLKSASLIPASVVSKYSNTQLKPLSPTSTNSTISSNNPATSPTSQLAPTIQPPQIHPEPQASYASSIGDSTLIIHEDTTTYSSDSTPSVNTTQVPTPSGVTTDNNAGGLPAQRPSESPVSAGSEGQTASKRVATAANDAAHNVQQRAENAAHSVQHAADRVAQKLPSLGATTDASGRQVGDVQSQPPNVAQHAQVTQAGDVNDPLLDQYKEGDHPTTRKITEAVANAQASASSQFQHAKQSVRDTVQSAQQKLPSRGTSSNSQPITTQSSTITSAVNSVQNKVEDAAHDVQQAADRVAHQLSTLPAATDASGRPVGDVQSQPPNVAQHAQVTMAGDVNDPLLDQYKEVDHPTTHKLNNAIDNIQASASNQLETAKQSVEHAVDSAQQKLPSHDAVNSNSSQPTSTQSSTVSDAATRVQQRAEVTVHNVQQRAEDAAHSVQHAADRVVQKLPSLSASTDASGRQVGDIQSQPPNVAQHAQVTQTGDVNDPLLDQYKEADHPATREINEAMDNAQSSASSQLEHAKHSVRDSLHSAQQKLPAREATNGSSSQSATTHKSTMNDAAARVQQTAEDASQSVQHAAKRVEAQLTPSDSTKDAAHNTISKAKQTIVDAPMTIQHALVDGQLYAQSTVQSAREKFDAAKESIEERTADARANVREAADNAAAAAKAKADDVVNRRVPELVSQFETIAHVAQQDVKHMLKTSPVKHATPLETELRKEQSRDDATAPALPAAEVEHIAKHQEISESQATVVASSGTSVETASNTAILASQPDERQPEVNLLSDAIKQQQSIGESVSADAVLPPNNAAQDAKTLRRIALQNIHRAREINASFDEDTRKDSVDAIPVLHQTLLERHRSSNAEVRRQRAEKVDADLNSTNTASVLSHSLSTPDNPTPAAPRSTTHTFFASSIGRRLRQLLMFSLTGPTCMYLTRIIMAQVVMPGQSPKQVSILRGTLQQRLILLAIMLPLYNILLNLYGAILGERAMARRMTNRMFGRLLPL